MPAPDPSRVVSLLSEPEDRMTAVICDDLISAEPGLCILLEDDAANGTEDRFFTSQTAFLSRAFDPPATGRVQILLRRQDALMQKEEWERGLQLLAAVLQASPEVPVELLALTEQAAQTFATRLRRPVAVLPSKGAPVADARRTVRVNEREGTICSDTAAIDIDAWNWSRLRRTVRFDLSSVQSDDLYDCCQRCNETGATTGAIGENAFLIVVPNGVGLGHLTRMLAIADELSMQAGSRIEFWCYSQGAAIIQAAGYFVHVRHTPKHLGCRVEDWHCWEVSDLVQTLRRLKPKAVVVDGSIIDMTLIEAVRDPLCAAPDIMWVRRGMWNPLANPLPLGGAQYATAVVVPGDLAQEWDTGPTAQVDPRTQGLSITRTTPPITFAIGNEALGKAEARRALRLGRFSRRKTCLVSLGGDAFDLLGGLPRQIAEAAARAKVRLIWVRSPLARVPSPHLVQDDLRSIYPLGRFLQAFDGAISAVGYNSFHELVLRTEFPLLFVPMAHQRLDNQSERARFAFENGWADWLSPEARLQTKPVLDRFFDAVNAGAVFTHRPRIENGAAEAARFLLSPSGGE
ncbi:hypothetical protein [Pseudotabrizicola algicola]|uniref:Glycosyl transferase family 28 C-terminal domain-containing protein n=1 Tax=Pseudotabrizicola algicola TaxID=2709381 RepID=A0A6B3RKB6_9RHOB|nr:hypothetical protein [Pseudotabrizicola algicola]NEX45861.1 hypothetical protein [Pseudotabrizicola algicola]